MKANKEILDNFDYQCKKHGVKTADVAAHIGLTTEALRMSLRGSPTLGRMSACAEAIGCTLADLIGLQAPPPRINGYVEIDGVVYKVRTLKDILNLVEKSQLT